MHQRDDGRRVLAVFNLADRHLIMDVDDVLPRMTAYSLVL